MTAHSRIVTTAVRFILFHDKNITELTGSSSPPTALSPNSLCTEVVMDTSAVGVRENFSPCVSWWQIQIKASRTADDCWCYISTCVPACWNPFWFNPERDREQCVSVWDSEMHPGRFLPSICCPWGHVNLHSMDCPPFLCFYF